MSNVTSTKTCWPQVARWLPKRPQEKEQERPYARLLWEKPDLHRIRGAEEGRRRSLRRSSMVYMGNAGGVMCGKKQGGGHIRLDEQRSFDHRYTESGEIGTSVMRCRHKLQCSPPHNEAEMGGPAQEPGSVAVGVYSFRFIARTRCISSCRKSMPSCLATILPLYTRLFLGVSTSC